MKNSLCRHCNEGCKDFEYVRFDKRGNLQCFQYCKGGEEKVKLSEWYIQKDGYVYSTSKIEGKKRLYHTLFKREEGLIIDHIDGDRTDNRLRMLREVSYSENSQNTRLWKDKRITSKYPGVYWNRNRKCWTCQVRKYNVNNPNYVHIKKDGFETEEEAFDCYLSVLKEMGREINTETEAYKDYWKWKREQQQSSLDAFV